MGGVTDAVVGGIKAANDSGLISAGLKAGGTLASSYLGAKSAEDAAKEQTKMLEQGITVSKDAQREAMNKILATTEPGLEDIISGFQSAIAITEQPLFQDPIFLTSEEQLMDAPEQAFLRDEQERAILRNAAAIGGLGGGNVREELQRRAFGRAATAQGQQANLRMQQEAMRQQQRANLANLLTAAGGQTAAFRSGMGTNLANIAMGGATQQIPLLTGIGEVKGAGQIGLGSAYQQGLGGVAQTLGGLV